MMGDKRRFDLFASCVARNFPWQEQEIADVAGGKGHLQVALMERGFHKITTWDKRHRRASRKLRYRYGWFDHRNAPRGYNLVVGMHPDGGTDEIIAYCAKHRSPFVVCPCCVQPSAAAYSGASKYSAWVDHLARLAERANFNVDFAALKMAGRNVVLIGRPQSGSRP